MQNIHDTHMEVSYNQDHPIHIYIEDYVNQSQNFVIDRTFIISINRFDRYDMSLCFLKNQIYQTKESFIDSFKHYCLKESNIQYNHVNEIYRMIENDKQYLIKHFNQSIIDIIESLVKLYEGIVNQSNINIFEWIYRLYDELKNIKNDDGGINKYIGTLYFLGLQEWFHLSVIDRLYNRINKKTNNICTIVWGEENAIELENLSDLTIDEIMNHMNHEYCSHSILYMIDKNNISIYDPDYDYQNPSIEGKEKRLCNFMSKKYLSFQSITDDQYCVFHCIDFLFKLVDAISVSSSAYSEKTIKIFMNYINEVNQISKKSDIHTFIKNLSLRSSLHSQLKQNK
jgi:hypothetical protein